VEIARLELGYVSENLADQHRDITFGERVVELIVDEGFSPTYGARNIKRAIQKNVEDPLSDMILKNQLPDKPLRMTIDDEGNLAIDLDFSQLDPAGFKPEEEEAAKD
jgi:ATP-dependent Clp protease ATP-binding subunit ClpA